MGAGDFLNQIRAIASGERKKYPKKISHNALANCTVLTRGEKYFLTHVITVVY